MILEPNFDLNANIGRALILVNDLSATKNNTLVLTIERMQIYDFLIKSPLILVKVLKELNKKIPFSLKGYEVDSISSLYPDQSNLLDSHSIKKLILTLFAYNLIDILKEDKNFYLSTTDYGSEIASNLDSDYFLRLREFSIGIKALHSTTVSSIYNIIKHHLHG